VAPVLDVATPPLLLRKIFSRTLFVINTQLTSSPKAEKWARTVSSSVSQLTPPMKSLPSAEERGRRRAV
jgi:hypothetical protein